MYIHCHAYLFVTYICHHEYLYATKISMNTRFREQICIFAIFIHVSNYFFLQKTPTFIGFSDKYKQKLEKSS